VHPGVVTTELARGYPKPLVALFHLFTLSPARGARTSLDVAMDPAYGTESGKYFEKSRPKVAAASALVEADQERLWAISEKMVEVATSAAA
jgi:retinol dehydrogenase-12